MQFAERGRNLPRLLVVAIMLAICPAAHAAVLYETTFPETQGLPADWQVLVGAAGNPGWHIDSGGDFRFNGSGIGLATYTGPLADGTSSAALENFTVVTELRKSDGGTNMTGLAARLQDSGNYYHARLRANNQLQLYRFTGGSATQLGPTVTTGNNYLSGQTWRLAMTFEGDQITTRLFNHTNVLMASLTETDPAFTSGFAGLRAQDPSAYEAFTIKTPTLLAYEGFHTTIDGAGDSYQADATIRGVNKPRLGFTGPWTSGNQFATSVDYYPRIGGLVPNVDTTPGMLEMFRTSGDSSDLKSLRRNLDYQFDAEDDIWISYAFQFDGLSTANGGSFIEVQLVSDATDRDLTFQILPDENGPSGIGRLIGGGNDGSTLDLGTITAGEMHALIIKVEPSRGGPNDFYDAISAWLDPSLEAPGAPDATGFGVARNQGSTLGDLRAFDALRLTVRPQPAPFSFYFDEFRIGTSFGMVAPIPEPSSAVIMMVGALCALLLRRRRSR